MPRAARLAAFTLFCASSLLAGLSWTAPYHAGIAKLGGAQHSNTAIWYPTETAEVPWQAGPFSIAASQGAPLAEGRFPLVLLSHGRSGGPLSHRELAAHLAREGFVVITPTHADEAPATPPSSHAQTLFSRPREAVAALEAALRDDRFGSQIDPDRLGVVGYSAGGYTGLVLAGARPDFALSAAYCHHEGRDDAGSCGLRTAAPGDSPQAPTPWQQPSPFQPKALVLLDPLATMFDAPGLQAVQAPTQIYRPQDDSLMRAQANALRLAASLPHPTQVSVVSGNHFTFVDPCPQAIAATAPRVCEDPPGLDRAAVHGQLHTEISDFLKRYLTAP